MPCLDSVNVIVHSRRAASDPRAVINIPAVKIEYVRSWSNGALSSNFYFRADDFRREIAEIGNIMLCAVRMDSIYNESSQVKRLSRLVACFIRHGSDSESHRNFAQSERACHFVLPFRVCNCNVRITAEVLSLTRGESTFSSNVICRFVRVRRGNN